MTLIEQIQSLYANNEPSEEFAALAANIPADEWNEANHLVRAERGLAPRGLLHAEKEALLALCAAHSQHAVEQGKWFIEACEEDRDDWGQLAGNPDLVAALDHTTADVWLGWR